MHGKYRALTRSATLFLTVAELLLTANGGEGPSSSSESEDSGNDADKQEETPKVDDATISGRLDGVQQPRKR